MLALFKPVLNSLANLQSLLRFFTRTKSTESSYSLGRGAKDNVVVIDAAVVFARLLGSVFATGDDFDV